MNVSGINTDDVSNSQGGNAPLVRGISILTAQDLPSFSAGPHGVDVDPYAASRSAGYEAVQTLDPNSRAMPISHRQGLVASYSIPAKSVNW